jgi:hypothetical protein
MRFSKRKRRFQKGFSELRKEIFKALYGFRGLEKMVG